jgi:protein TonB
MCVLKQSSWLFGIQSVDFMSMLPRHRVEPDCSAWSGIRTILVPPDIVAVQRRSPVRPKKRTPWHPQPDGQASTERCGGRDWFSDRLFVEPHDGHARVGYGTAITMHVCWAAALIVILIARPDRAIAVSMRTPLVMPAVVVVPPPPIEQTSLPSPEPPKPKTSPYMTASAVPAALARGVEVSPAAAPVEAPSGVTPETGAENLTKGSEGGVAGGVAGGIVGGVGSGGPAASGPPAPVLIRVGADMKPPRKLKDAKPVYPAGAMAGHTQGAVIIEAIIGMDGKVQDARVVHSVPTLDQAALDAVRQWEYAPSLLNGVPVAVIMTVVVNFALQ